MRNLFFHLSALLLSVTAHLGVAFALNPTNAILVEPGLAQRTTTTIFAQLKAVDRVTESARTMPIELKKTDGVSNDSQTPLIEQRESVSEEVTHSVSEPSQSTDLKPQEDIFSLPVLMSNEPYYFRSYELSEPPVVLQDVPAENVLTLPDTAPPVVLVRLLINEQGEVDQVEFDEVNLSEQVKKYIADSFARVIFAPGKVGDLAVKSELSIEVTLEQVVGPIQTPVTVH